MLSKDEARDEWDLISGATSEIEVHHWFGETKLSDAGELCVYDFSDQVVSFVRKVLPRLKVLLDADLTPADPAV